MNIIVTSIHNLTVEQIKPFMRTAARRANYDLMWVACGRTSDDVLDYLRTFKSRINYAHLPGLQLQGVHWNNRRFMEYFRHIFLPKKIPNEANVLVCDSRDVIFQDDPFPLLNGSMHYAGEAISMWRSRAMIKWVGRSFGPRWLWKLRNRKPICAGTFGGPCWKLSGVMARMSKEIDWSFTNRWSGLDQALLNVIAFECGGTVHSNNEPTSPFLTIDSEPNIRHDKFGRYVNNVDQVIPIVHQWDRAPLPQICHRCANEREDRAAWMRLVNHAPLGDLHFRCPLCGEALWLWTSLE
jgi:hypothetical protein